MAATCIIQPVDMVKVRIQIGAKGGPVRFLWLTHQFAVTSTGLKCYSAFNLLHITDSLLINQYTRNGCFALIWQSCS